MFVCLEGVDGVGKSTIAANVRKTFTLNNVILCSDPCKEHPATLALRQFLLSRGNSLPVATQIKLFDAAREILIFDFIEPALNSNALVICDRFWLSTIVYQNAEDISKFPIDLLFYLTDSADNIKARNTKLNLVSDFTTSERMELDKLDAKYRQAINENKEYIKETVCIDASDIASATYEIVRRIAEKMPSLRIHTKDFSVRAHN